MATPWQVPPLWQGKTVVVLASGPSMSPAVAQAVRAAGLPALAVNDTWRLAPWADLLYAADKPWWEVHMDTALKFAGLKVSSSEPAFRAVLSLRNTGFEGFDPDPECIRTGGNGGYAAVHIAAHAGAKRILLCGMDMSGGHWHADHTAPLRNPPPSTFAKWIARFATLAPELKARGIEVLNCTRGSALACFPMRDLNESLKEST